jgi:mRNA-degrading endonuclease toxin of MazEF toxin-antitoxin module
MKNINDDYLWDQTGEPDPEIQQLEQVLGALRYQPRPLEIPAELGSPNRQAFFPRLLAIAATIAILLLGAGLWVGLRRQSITPVVTVTPRPANGNDNVAVTPTPVNNPVAPPAPIASKDKSTPRRNRPLLSNALARHVRPIPAAPELAASERKEAEAAKEQLILALRVASSKLSFAQRKAQEINSENMVHNQHKIG